MSAAHNNATCRNCAEITRTAEVLANAGHEALGVKLLDEHCEAEGGKPLDVLIEDYNVELDKVRRQIPGKVIALPPPTDPATPHYPFGPPLTIPSGFRRYTSFSDTERKACVALVETCESPEFMRKAAETVIQWAFDRWEAVNKAAGLERDGRKKREEEIKRDAEEAAAKAEREKKARDSFRDRLGMGGTGRVLGPGLSSDKQVAGGEMRLFTRRELTAARSQADKFVITHLDGSVRHSWVGSRGSDCPMCKRMPDEVELLETWDVNRHGRTKKQRDVVVLREVWMSGDKK